MRLSATVLLTSLVILTVGSCSKTYIRADVPCPDRPNLLAIPEDMQLAMGADAVLIVTENQLALKEYAKKLEVRARCKDF